MVTTARWWRAAGFSQMGAVEDITKRRWEVWDAGGIPTVTRRAFKDATTFPTGPVYVAYASSALEATNVEGLIQAADAPHMGLVPDAARHPRDLGRAAQRREAPAGLRAGHRARRARRKRS